jgi:hypothetical protein
MRTAEDRASVVSRMFELLGQVTLPLFEESAGPPKLVGTAFLVLHEDRPFLVSAGHVLKELQRKHLYYYVEKGLVRKVTGRLTTNHHDGRPDADLVDVGAVRMEGIGLPPYESVGKFLWSSEDIKLERVASTTASYGFVGYPATRSTPKLHPKEIRVEPYAYLTGSAPLIEYAGFGVAPWSHLCLTFNNKKSRGLDDGGRSFPKPHGVSGSPVFLLDTGAESDQPENFELAGLVTTWRPREKLIIATSGALLLGLLRAAA